MQIIYCTRTHTQLSQFVHELQASPFGASVRAVALGSRATLCTNRDVRKVRLLSRRPRRWGGRPTNPVCPWCTQLGSLHRINEACLDLQQAKRDAQKDAADEEALLVQPACPGRE
jgi:hypothetical protein